MIKALQKKIKKARNFDGALITSPENRRYFTGFSASNGYLLVTADRAVFITDSRYIEAAQHSIKGCEVALQTQAVSQLSDLFKAAGAQHISIEASRTTVRELSRMEAAFAPAELAIDCSAELDDMIDALRMVKSAAELRDIKAAQQIAEDAFFHILDFIKPGITEKQIALTLDYYMLSHGAQALSFETIALSGKNTSMPHGVPSEKAAESGDFITMDFGAVVNEYHSDMTRTVAVGRVSDRQREIYNTVLKAQETALAALRPGLSAQDADAAARTVIEQAGYGDFFGHSTGHGVGIEIHELPNLTPAKTAQAQRPLEAGNVVTVEPGIYLPGEFGVRIEDFAVITETGSENLTHAPKELIIL